MYEFWYGYIKPRYQNNVKLCYMDTGNFIIHIKPEEFCKDIADDVKSRYNTKNYEVDRPLPKAKNKKVIGLMKDQLVGKIITEFVALRPKTCSYWTDNDKSAEKAKRTIKCVIKRTLKFDDYKYCLFKDEIILKSQQRFKNERRCVYTEEINKIALSSSDDKRLQTFHRIITYSYGDAKQI